MTPEWLTTAETDGPDQRHTCVEGLDTLILAGLAERIIHSRRTREAAFIGHRVFSDPAWDILLEVYICSARKRAVTVSDVAVSAEIASSSATRWVRALEDQGLLKRLSDVADKRRVLLGLTDIAKAMMEKALGAFLDHASGAASATHSRRPMFFASAPLEAVMAPALTQLLFLTEHIADEDFPVLLLKCLSTIPKELYHHNNGTAYEAIDVQMQRMIGIRAYESAVLVLGRSIAPSWVPFFSHSQSRSANNFHVELARAMLADLLRAVLDGLDNCGGA